MGILRSLKRWFNRADAYDQLIYLNRFRFLVGGERLDDASTALYRQLNEGEESSQDEGEGLLSAELSRNTSKEAIAKREAAIEREKRFRESNS
jgi:hypothetical protein